MIFACQLLKRTRRAIGLNTTPQIDCVTPLPARHRRLRAFSWASDLFSNDVPIDEWELYRVGFLKRANLVLEPTYFGFTDGDPKLLSAWTITNQAQEAAMREKQRLLERYQVRDAERNETMDDIALIIVTSSAFLAQIGFVIFHARSVGRKEIDMNISKQNRFEND